MDPPVIGASGRHYRRLQSACWLPIDSGERVMLLKRSLTVDEPGTWHCAGGYCDEGESFFEAAIREAREELTVGGVLPNFVVERILDFTDKPFMSRVFVVRLEDRGPTYKWLLNDEHTEIKWMGPEEDIGSMDLHWHMRWLLKKLGFCLPINL